MFPFGKIPIALILAAGILCGAGSGCRLVQIGEVEPAWKSEIRDSLAASLTQEQWQRRWEWSPEREWETRETRRPAASSLRWRLGVKEWPEFLAALESQWAKVNSSQPSFDAEVLLGELAREDNLAGWHAAILLARQHPAETRYLEPVLKRLAAEPPEYPPAGSESGSAAAAPRRIPVSMQAAAAEAWCLVLASAEGDPIEALAPAGQALVNENLPVEVRGELFRGIGRWVPPSHVPGLDHALAAGREPSSHSRELRHAAIDACVLYALWNPGNQQVPADAKTPKENPWPRAILDWQWEPDAYFERDPEVRRRFAYWMALTGHPNAAKVLESQLTDQEPAVRDDALVHLGMLKTKEALESLRFQARRPEPRVRAMAVKGLAHWGAGELAAYLNDSSYEVRVSVAEELGRFATVESARRLRELGADASREVETAALEATRDWPDELAIPVLLHGMQHASLTTRRNCFRELRRRTGLKETFPIAAGPEVREEAARALARTWNLPMEFFRSEDTLPANPKINRLRVAELETYLLDLMDQDFPANSARHQLAIKSLKESSPEDVPAIEAFVLEQPPSPRTEEIVRDVLPALSPVYEALAKLESNDAAGRRLAASELRALADGRSLSPLAVRTLRDHLKNEADGLVWRSAVLAVLPDSSREIAELIAWAANHPDGGIRRLACEYAARHRGPAFADWLLPLIHDSQQPVQLAAIEAAGRCRNRIVIDGVPGSRPEEQLPGLRSLLADRELAVSVAAAIAMSRLGDPQGHDELIRLSHHPDHQIRLKVIAAMGAGGQTRFVEPLVSIAWTARDDRVKQAVLDSLEQLVPVEKHPPALGNTASADGKIKLWAQWWDETQNPAAGRRAG